MAEHSRPRHWSKCPGCTRLVRSGDNHPNKCRSCHDCTVDNKCNTCSQWTDVVWAGIVERSHARLNRKRRAVSETQAYDKPSTTLKPGLRDEHIQKQAVSTWTVDRTAWTIVPPVGFPTRQSEHLRCSPCQWTYAGGPTPGRKPETFLRAKAGDAAGSPEPNPEVDPFRPRSPNDREIPEPDKNPRRHTVRLVSPGARRNPRPNSGQSRTDQSETAAGRLRSRSPVLPSCEPPICVPTCVPTSVTRTSWSHPLSGDFAGVSRHATTSRLIEPVFSRRESAPCPPKRLTGLSVPGINRR